MWEKYSIKMPDRQRCSLLSGDWMVKMMSDGLAHGAYRRPLPAGVSRAEYTKGCPKIFTDSPEHRLMWDTMFFREAVLRSTSMPLLKMFIYVFDSKDYASWEDFMASMGGKISVVEHADWTRINIGKHFIEVANGMMFK